MDNQPRIFCSHTTRDRRDHFLAHQIAKGLRACGAQIWIAPDNIPFGSDWEHEIVAGIMRQCTHFFVIISAASSQAEWVQREISLANERFVQEPSFGILPLFVGKVGSFPGSDFVNRFQRIPYHDDSLAQLTELRDGLGLRLVGIEMTAELATFDRLIEVRPHKRTFAIGDEIRILVRADAACFLSLINIGATGETNVIVPNCYQAEPRLVPGNWYTYPSVEHDYTLPLVGPSGTERILAIGSTTPIKLHQYDVSAMVASVPDAVSGGALSRIPATLRSKVIGIGSLEFEVVNST